MKYKSFLYISSYIHNFYKFIFANIFCQSLHIILFTTISADVTWKSTNICPNLSKWYNEQNYDVI
jgi:hypothetical protein